MSELVESKARTKKDDQPAWTEGECIAALRRRYPKSEYALLPQVRNATGFARVTRTADALIMSLWPSRGLELWGIEIKSSRSDLKREIDNPAKAEEIAQRCDRWWIAVGHPKVVEGLDLPAAWGLLIPRNGEFVVAKAADKLESKEITRPFLAALLRAAQEYNPHQEAMEAAISRANVDARKKIDEEIKTAIRCRGDRYDRLLEEVKQFERDTGIALNSWSSVGNSNVFRMAVALAAEFGKDIERMGAISERFGKISESLREAIGMMPNADAFPPKYVPSSNNSPVPDDD